MASTIAQELAALGQLTTSALRVRYLELFGYAPLTGNRAWLVKRIGWRLQVQDEDDLSERARRRASELANDADLRLSPRVMAGQSCSWRSGSPISSSRCASTSPPGRGSSRSVRLVQSSSRSLYNMVSSGRSRARGLHSQRHRGDVQRGRGSRRPIIGAR